MNSLLSTLLSRRESNDKLIIREVDMYNAILYRINKSTNNLEIDELKLELQIRRNRINNAEIENKELQIEIDKLQYF